MVCVCMRVCLHMVFEQGILAHLNEKETLEANVGNKYQLVYCAHEHECARLHPAEQWQIKEPL